MRSSLKTPVFLDKWNCTSDFHINTLCTTPVTPEETVPERRQTPARLLTAPAHLAILSVALHQTTTASSIKPIFPNKFNWRLHYFKLLLKKKMLLKVLWIAISTLIKEFSSHNYVLPFRTDGGLPFHTLGKLRIHILRTFDLSLLPFPTSGNGIEKKKKKDPMNYGWNRVLPHILFLFLSFCF